MGDAMTAPPVAPRTEVAFMEGYHSPQVDVAVRLNTNEAPQPPPAAFTERLIDALRDTRWHRYPDRTYMDLRTALAAHHGVQPAQVFVANGSNEVLQTLCLTYGGSGRRAALFEPTYALHGHIARVTGTHVVVGERDTDFALDLDGVRRVLNTTDPAVTFLCSPNNPTGMVDPEATVREIASMVSPAGLLVIDEAYGQFAPWSALELVTDDQPLAVTRTYSKTWAMAGARLGYLVGPRWLVAELDKVVLPYHLDTTKQLAGRIALQFVDEMHARIDAVVKERDRVTAALRGLEVDVWPSGANFVLFRPQRRPGADVWRQLLERSVLVRDCSSWRRLEGCLRVTIGTSAEDDTFLSALEEVLR